MNWKQSTLCASVMLVALAWTSVAFCGEIHDATKNGDLEKVKELLIANPDLVFSKDNTSSFCRGGTPLHFASWQGHKDVAELLLVHKADVNATSISGDTPLHLAAAFGYSDIVELLLESNAVVNAKNKSGYTPLRRAVENGNIEVVKLLLAQKADVNTRDNFGETPLAGAAGTDHADVAKLLLANKADVNARSDIDGETPLHVAAWRGYKDMVELLLASNADVNVVSTDAYKVTPLQLAVEYDHPDVAELLRQHSAHGHENTTGPLVGWYSDGDTGFQMGYQVCLEKIPYDKAISDDVRNFVEKLPIVKAPFGLPNRSENYWITHMSFFVDGTGQHAVLIDEIPINGTYINYVLIYNKSDVRAKVVKFSSGHYQS